jgi:HK97 family phage portal protein
MTASPTSEFLRIEGKMAPLTLLNLPDPPEFKMSGASTLTSPTAEFTQALLGFPASAGKPVTRATAIRVAAVLTCIKTVAQDIAKMPLPLREVTTTAGRQRTQLAVDNPLYPLFMYSPNRWQTSYEARFFQATQLLTNGNSFFQKICDQKGDVVELIPLNAWSMAVRWDADAPLVNAWGAKITEIDKNTGRKVLVPCWEYFDGQDKVIKFYQPDLWHTTYLNLEGIGIEGASMVALGKEAISLLIAAEEYAGRNFANGLGMGGFISFPPEVDMDEVQQQNVIDRLKKDFSGSQNAGKFTMIPHGGKWEKMTFNAQESQVLDSRKWNEETIARMYGGAPLVVKLGYGQQNSTYASSSAFLDEYFNTVLAPICTAIEQTISRDVIDLSDRGKLYVKHNADIFLRGSPKERAETNAELIQSGQMTPNEARAIEDRDYIEGADFLTLGTGTPVIFDIENDRFFIPGQLQPQLTDDEAEQKKDLTPPPPVMMPQDGRGAGPDAAGSDDDEDETQPPVPKKGAKKAAPPKKNARLEQISASLVDRVLRKEEKGGITAKWLAEVLMIAPAAAEKFVEIRPTLNAEDVRAKLLALAQGEQDDDR